MKENESIRPEGNVDNATLGQSHCVLVALEEVVGEIGAPIRHRLAPSQEYE